MAIYIYLYKMINKGLIRASVEFEDSSELLINLNTKIQNKINWLLSLIMSWNYSLPVYDTKVKFSCYVFFLFYLIFNNLKLRTLLLEIGFLTYKIFAYIYP